MEPSPASMIRRVVLAHPNELSLERVPRLAPSSDDCLIRVSVVAVCSADLKTYIGGQTRLELGDPPILGHEVSGIVQQSGSCGPAVGTLVGVIGSKFCRSCTQCLRGR